MDRINRMDRLFCGEGSVYPQISQMSTDACGNEVKRDENMDNHEEWKSTKVLVWGG